MLCLSPASFSRSKLWMAAIFVHIRWLMNPLFFLSTAATLLWSVHRGVAAEPGSVQGVVHERAGQELRPLARAFVSIASSSGETLATTRSDANGQYRFVNLPQDRFTLSAAKPGYLTRQAAGRAGSHAILDCSSWCRQSGLNFELARGAVLAGVVLDELSEPVSRATVSLRQTGASESGGKPSMATTDNKGRFRIAGLSAGSCTITVRRRAPGGRDDLLTKTLNVAEGEETTDLVLTLGSRDLYRIAGSVSGIPYGEGYRTWVSIRPLSSSVRALQASVGPDGRFQFSSVMAGRYRTDAAAVQRGTVERTDYFMDVIDVVADTDGLSLQPVAPATASGTVELAAGKLPQGARIRFTSTDGFGNRWTGLHGAGREFELTGLRPGSYRVEADSTEFYVKGVKTTGEVQSPKEVIVSPGVNRLTILAAADQSQVYGVILDPKTSRPLPNARVALQGDRGEYSVQSDQVGRFLFGKIIPGDYRICAWTDIAPERVEEEASWEQAGCQSRIIPIAPSSEVEIDLKAAP